jgi:hypothetical protein
VSRRIASLVRGAVARTLAAAGAAREACAAGRVAEARGAHGAQAARGGLGTRDAHRAVAAASVACLRRRARGRARAGRRVARLTSGTFHRGSAALEHIALARVRHVGVGRCSRIGVVAGIRARLRGILRHVGRSGIQGRRAAVAHALYAVHAVEADDVGAGGDHRDGREERRGESPSRHGPGHRVMIVQSIPERFRAPPMDPKSLPHLLGGQQRLPHT